ncbi:ABC-2 type transport system ATP-binding protein [Thalassobacillus cyri]|uniref:ABC-2 type transport system ATP-binding protein n=1 Tax=Thalassobacillus cyri TaxID=571932 RepID=A0A1H4HH92_9BACI|nr:ABC transporter ATP-binding protein [Thalassobacillus cyri]SEB21006.1 ABC-2 type transport system ATP-binding protein [Thalassobacillus cyri]
MIEIKGLSHAYQKNIVLDAIHLTIGANERCALVGRNGAGKSTLIRLLLGLEKVKKGTITLAGHSNKTGKWKSQVSYLPEKFQLYPHLTGFENMRFFASLADKEISDTIMEEKLKLVALWEDRNKTITSYSKGMLQRLGLAVTLYYDTDIIILDEPTSGLDPIGREKLLQIIDGLEGKTILMASHHLSEIERVCTDVAFLEAGKLTKYNIHEFIGEQMKRGSWA